MDVGFFRICQANLCLLYPHTKEFRMASICLKIFRGIYKGACHIMYNILGRRIILIIFIRPITPNANLDQAWVLVLSKVNKGSTLRGI